MPSSKSRRDDRHSRKDDDRKKEKRSRDPDDDDDDGGGDSSGGEKKDDNDGNDKRRDRGDGKSDNRERKHDRSRRRKERKDDKEDDDRRKRRKRDRSDDDDSDDGSDSEEDRKRRKRKRDRRKDKRRKKSSSRKRDRRSSKKHRKKRDSSSSSSSSSSSDDSDSSSESSSDDNANPSRVSTVKGPSKKLLAKLSARGETLEEYKERKNQRRAAKIATRFGYTAESNPFNDPNLHETFTWTKKQNKTSNNTASGASKQKQNADTLEEIETIRRRRLERQQEQEEMERIKADEARMKELEHYDDWAKKEEEFHLQQQRQRSAIRLVEGREKPVDVLAKNLLLFGLTDEERTNQAAVKYKERYNALDELENVEAELEEPFKLLEILKLEELRELLIDIDAFRALEKETFSGNPNNSIIRYWEALRIVACDEIKLLDHGEGSAYARKMEEIKAIFKGQSQPALVKMKGEVEDRIKKMVHSNDPSQTTDGDPDYWRTVLDQLTVHLAKLELSDLHSKMLVRQLEKLEQKKEELTRKKAEMSEANREEEEEQQRAEEQERSMVPKNVAPDFGNLEEELGLTSEVDLGRGDVAAWHDKYRPRKPRYFNRVKTGYDWNKYNQTHYDFDNPPPKSVQGYKFNIFYPDLVDPTKTPQFFLEPADSDDFCILRFHAGPPYEDIAFKIINREWNRSRKRGYRCTFERGVLSLYFNFSSHWYRR